MNFKPHLENAREQLRRAAVFAPEAILALSVVFAAWAMSGVGSSGNRSIARITPPAPVVASSARPPIAPTVSRPVEIVKAPVVAKAPSKASTILAEDLLDEQEDARIEQAKELLGKFYDRSVVKAGEKLTEVKKFVRARVARAVKSKYKKHARAISDTVLAESERLGLDPMFLLAVIENESSFNPFAIGPVGEIGLMQITPATGKWISGKYKIPYKGVKSLRDPKTNIRIGAAYLAQLRESFDFHGRLYLAAYNMGSRNVRSALARSIWPKDYAQAVMKRYLRLYAGLKSELKSKAPRKGV